MVTDQTLPEGKWVFDAAVTDAFDDMLERSIPAYNVMRDLTRALARRFVRPGTDVLDLGCSRGQALEPLVHHEPSLGVRQYVGVDVSQPMLAAARSRFAPEVADGRVAILDLDLRRAYPSVDASVTLAVLTLMFVPVEHRQRLVQDIYDHTVPGGAVIVVEKVLGSGARLHDIYDAEYLAFKNGNRYTEEQIARKKASLEGVLVSLTADQNVAMLREAGFRTVDGFYRWLNFAGWVAIR